MPTFAYRAIDARGKVTSGSVESGSRNAVAALIQGQGLIPLQIQEEGVEQKAAEKRDVTAFLGRVRRRHVMDFVGEVSALLDAGIPLEQALAIEADQCEHEGLRKILQKLLEDVRAGLALSAALSRHPGVFPRIMVSMVRAGEEASAMETVMRRLSTYMERAEETRSKVIGAMAYPALLLAVGLMALVVLFTYLVPKFAVIFADQKAAMPFLTRALLSTADVVTAWWWALPLLIVLPVFFQRMYVRDPERRERWDRKLLATPLLGALLLKAELARVARMLETLLSGGVPVLTAIQATRQTVQNTALAAVIAKMYDEVHAGRPMAGPLGESDAVPPLVSRMVAIGEESGRVEQMLGKVAERYEKETDRLTETITSLLGPALIVVMGVLVAFVYIGMISGILAISSAVG